jgi:hypothetical protein
VYSTVHQREEKRSAVYFTGDHDIFTIKDSVRGKEIPSMLTKADGTTAPILSTGTWSRTYRMDPSRLNTALTQE